MDVNANSKAKEAVTPGSQDQANIIAREEKVEYRDQDGNLLNEAQVKGMEGKASFSTKYETRTQVLNADGQVVFKGEEGVAPPHPDAEPGTKGLPDHQARDSPPKAPLEAYAKKESSVENKDTGTPRPGSEANEATKK